MYFYLFQAYSKKKQIQLFKTTKLGERMPLSKIGEKMKRKLEEEYGVKKGKQVFYSMEHKHKEWVKKK